MLVKQILENDMDNCYEAFSADSELAELDKGFYQLANTMSDKDKLEMEDVFSAYMARVTRIAYLQGMKDFAELHVVLKGDVTEILDS